MRGQEECRANKEHREAFALVSLPGDSVGLNGSDIQKVTRQFWLVTLCRREKPLPRWAGRRPS